MDKMKFLNNLDKQIFKLKTTIGSNERSPERQAVGGMECEAIDGLPVKSHLKKIEKVDLKA